MLVQGQTDIGAQLTGTLIDGTSYIIPIDTDGTFSIEITKKDVTERFFLTAESEGKWRTSLVLTIPVLAKDPNNQDTSTACFDTTESDGEITITNYRTGMYPECSSTEIVIPGVIAGKPVMSIGQYTFAGRQLTSVILPNSVNSIGNRAFVSNQLRSVILGTGVTTIGEGVFQGNQIISVTLPDSVTSIGARAFASNQLRSVTIPSGSIGEQAFSYNELSSVMLGTGVTSIGMQAFGNNQLILITIPSGSIGMQAFYNNQLTSLTLGSGVTSIGMGAFQNNQLTSVTIANGVMSIGYSAFQGNQLTSVTLPNSVTTIEQAAFQGNQLTSLTLGTGITNIGERVFNGNKLTSVTLLDSVTSIGMGAFQGNQLTSVTIADGVTSIGQGAFQGNQLRSVTLPNSVTSIGAYAFADNPQIVKGYRAAGTAGITVAGNANILVRDWTSRTSLSGAVVEKPGDPTKVIIQGQTESGAQLTGTLIEGTSYSIPIDTDGTFSFELAKTELTDKITLVADSGIEGKRRSDPLILNISALDPSNQNIPVACFVTSLSNGEITITDYKAGVYSECIAEVIIPESIAGNPVTSIGNDAFRYNQLTSVTLPNSITSIGNFAFFNNELTSVTIPDSVTSIGNWAFASNQLISLTLGTGLINIGDYAFQGPIVFSWGNQLTSVTLPNSVTSIGNFAFSNNQLTSVILGTGLTNIGSHAFSYNELTSVTLGSGVEDIGTYAFYNNQLRSVTVLNGSIGDDAFANNELSSVTLGNGVTSIGEGAFSVNQLRSVTLPNSVTNIGKYAFSLNPQRVKGYRENGEVGIVVDTLANIVVRNWTVTTPLTGQVVDKPQDPVIAIIQGETESGAQLTGTLADNISYNIPVDEEGKFILELEKKEAPQVITLIANSGGEKWRSAPLTLTVPALESTSDPEESESKKRSGGGATLVKKNPCIEENCDNIPSSGADAKDPETTLVEDDITSSPSEGGMQELYTRAFEKGLTTMPSFEEARFSDTITRAEFAKVISIYATKYLEQIPDASKTACAEYKDLDTTNAELAGYVIQSCELGLMGYWSNGVVTKEYFSPNGVVTRAEAATILSRLLRGNTYTADAEENWYQGHLSALQSEQIIQTNIAPSTPELRGNIYLMLKRI